MVANMIRFGRDCVRCEAYFGKCARVPFVYLQGTGSAPENGIFRDPVSPKGQLEIGHYAFLDDEQCSILKVEIRRAA